MHGFNEKNDPLPFWLAADPPNRASLNSGVFSIANESEAERLSSLLSAKTKRKLQMRKQYSEDVTGHVGGDLVSLNFSSRSRIQLRSFRGTSYESDVVPPSNSSQWSTTGGRHSTSALLPRPGLPGTFRSPVLSHLKDSDVSVHSDSITSIKE